MPSIVSHSKKFAFVHIAKTGGTSIVNALRPYEDHKWLKWGARYALATLIPPRRRIELQRRFFLTHMRAAELKARFDDFDRLFSFGFVRNPWDRHVSLYEYWRQTPSQPMFEVVRNQSFADYLRSLGPMHHGRQASWLHDETGRPLVSFIGRFENIENDFADICTRLGIAATLPHLNRSARRSYRDYYDDETRDLVARVDRTDIELFGYTF